MRYCRVNRSDGCLLTRVGWLRAHSKQIITHTTIIVGFVLVAIFVAEPLFDRIEAIPFEAQLQHFDLRAQTGRMRSCLDEFKTDGRTVVEVMGWAFMEGQDSENSEVYVVRKSADRTYIFDTMVRTRPDVTRHFAEMGLYLDQSGFSALVPTRRIGDGEHTVGIYIRKDDMEVLRYTHRSFTKSRGAIELTG